MIFTGWRWGIKSCNLTSNACDCEKTAIFASEEGNYTELSLHWKFRSKRESCFPRALEFSKSFSSGYRGYKWAASSYHLFSYLIFWSFYAWTRLNVPCSCSFSLISVKWLTTILIFIGFLPRFSQPIYCFLHQIRGDGVLFVSQWLISITINNRGFIWYWINFKHYIMSIVEPVLELIIHTVLLINYMYFRSVYIYIWLSEYENKECKRHCK